MADDEKIYQRAERPPYMQRIRNVRPEFFKHEGLFDLERETGLPIRLGFEGLWTCCDREGRFQWRPRRLGTDILPYDEVDFSRVLDALTMRGFAVRYEVDGDVYGCVPSWHKNQSINTRETASQLPPPPETLSGQQIDACPTGASRVPDACPTRAIGVGVGVGDGDGDKTLCSELEKPPASEPPILSLPCVGKGGPKEYPITQNQVDEWSEAFPGVDVMANLRQAKTWLTANSTKRKTYRGVPRFVVSWLGRTQDRAGANGKSNHNASSSAPPDYTANLEGFVVRGGVK